MQMRELHTQSTKQGGSVPPLPAQPLALLKLPEVCRRTALSKTSIYSMIKAGTFPAQIPLGGKSTAWIEGEIDAWIAARISAARATGGRP